MRDRLAAVTNRVADVQNGERLEVVDHDRRFYQVKTEKGAIGWIDDHVVIDQKTYDQFVALAKDNSHDPVIVTGVLRDESNLHIAPGREQEHFYMLPENAKLQLLKRASILKPMPAQAVPVPLPVPQKHALKKRSGKKGADEAPAVPEGPPMQDWWLVRDDQGHTGWVWSRMLDTDIPQEIAGLAENQRYVAAYRLRTVDDPGSKFPDGQAPEYVAMTNSWKDGLPYDFDQVRVFTWNTRKHRYEGAFRERDIEGYLPLTIGSGVFGGQTEPTFSFKVAMGGDVSIDPATGAARAAQTTTETYRLEGDLVKKVEPPGTTPAPKAGAPAGTEKRHIRSGRRKRGRRR